MPNPLNNNQMSFNPMVMLQNMAMNNPQARQILQLLQNGQNPQQLFYQLCKERGIDPQQFLNNLQNGNYR